jgi:hypothetical protein
VRPLRFLCAFLWPLSTACSGAAYSDISSAAFTPSQSGSAGSQEAGSSSGSSGASESGRPAPSSGSDGTADATTAETGPEDAAPDVDDADAGNPGIPCGTTAVCMLPDQVCCTGIQLVTMPQCASATVNNCNGNGGGTLLRCDDSSDCAMGEVCCGSKSLLSSSYTSFTCRPTCPSSTIAMTYEQLCNPMNNDCPSSAPNCRATNTPSGFFACGP